MRFFGQETWCYRVNGVCLGHVPFGTLWVVASVAYMAINVLPVRMGEQIVGAVVMTVVASMQATKG